MGFYQHLQSFASLPVRNYEPGKKSRGNWACAWRLAAWQFDTDEEKTSLIELIDQFLTEYGDSKLTALVIGPWNYNDMCDSLGGRGAAEIVAVLVAGRKRMPNLKALFFGDILGQECEVSWLGHGDISPLLPAFPKLEEFHLRGTTNVSMGKINHLKLKKLVLQGGGLPADLLAEVWSAKLPNLEHLELWLGNPQYGGINNIAPLQPLLKGKLFPKLKYLGLRNSLIADDIAHALVESPLLNRIQTLDLSLGNLTDRGAEALLGSPNVRKLKGLDLQYHFLSAPFMKALKELPVEVDVGDQQEPYIWTHKDATEVWRFNSVGE